MDARFLLYIGLGCLAGFVVIVVIFLMHRKKVTGSQSEVLRKMMAKENSNSSSAFYQKMYIKLSKLPAINRYVYKIRRRLELIHNDDEFTIRNDTARIALKNIMVAFLASILLCYINRDDLFMMIVSLIGVLIVVENLTDQGVSKVENKLLVQMLDFLSEVRHHFHTSHMVEEAVYDASMMDDYEIVSQANEIYEILISADPEMELEKYYDVAPNRFLKAFAGVSYLTKEFGDRNIDGSSLYLKDINNITQELQMEVLKRDKLDYLFKSLTYIAVLPVLAIKPLEHWAMNSFNATIDFYEGKVGFLVQTLLLVTIFLSYAFLNRIKDVSTSNKQYSTNANAWQETVYRLPFMNQIIDGLVPAANTPKYASLKELLRETASKLKLEWLYVNRVISFLFGFFCAILIAMQMHKLAISQVLYAETTEGSSFGQMSEQDALNAKGLTSFDRYFVEALMKQNDVINAVKHKSRPEAIQVITQAMLSIADTPLDDVTADKFATRIFKELRTTSIRQKTEIQYAIIESRIDLPREGFSTALRDRIIEIAKENELSDVTQPIIKKALQELYTQPMTPLQASNAAERIYDKLVKLTSEYFSAIELLIALVIGFIAYCGPIIMLKFQKRMRYMEMEDEIMQFQTIILMLMHIERISVEMIIEWLARFSNIFREPLIKCQNNYESGAYEALEELKDDAPFKPFVRIVESLQAAAENVKITDAFDELESERNFFQEKRKESNERLINRKAKIGKVLGFTPMIFLFVGYLIGPLMLASLSDMGSYFTDVGGGL